MIRTFEAAVKFLEKYVPDPSKKYPGSLGLERMKEFCNLLDNPQLFYPTIHVGGTSGKGSTSTIIASILATKHKVGLHTSPHLVRINERIKLTGYRGQGLGDSADIKDNDFIDLLNEVKPMVEKMEKGKWGVPSYFEIVTAMAFLYFKQQKVDIAVIEVGLGGRFDATNVIKPVVAVLTNVGLDHTDVLGKTVEKIAQDKAGIFKPGVQVVTGVTQKSVIEIVKHQKANKLSLINEDFSYKIKSVTDKGSVFDYSGEKTIKNLKLNMLGEFQIKNAALAIRATELISNLDIHKGLKDAYIPGRLEIISRNPLVVLDGAHNPDKMSALVQSIKTIFPGKKVTALVAIKDDKNATEILKILLPICQEIVFTKYEIKADQGIIRSYDPEKLIQLAKSINSKKKYSLVEINNIFTRRETKDDLLLITGSLYLVGEIKKCLKSVK